MPGHYNDKFISGLGNKNKNSTNGTITRGNQNQRVMKATAGQFMFDDGTPVPAGTAYHIHPDKGPMEGAQHNPNIPGGQPGHRFLTPTNGNGRQTTRMNETSQNMGTTSGYMHGGRVHTSTGRNASMRGINGRMGRGRMKGELVSLGNGNYRWNGNGSAPTIHIECTDAGGNNTMADCNPYSAEIGGQEGSSAGGAYGDTGGAHHYNQGQYHGCPQCPPGQQTHIHY